MAGGLPGLPHFAPKAKRAIYLFMNGGPSQMDLFDYKPAMGAMFDKDLPDSIRMGQRLTTMTSGQARFPVAPSKYKFARHGQSGTWVSELLPWTAKLVDEFALVKSVWTEAINHDPAVTYICTGNQLPGRPSLGSWLSYGLGTMNRNLPAFVVMTASWTGRKEAQAIYNRLWGSGYLPSKHQGVALRSTGDPVLYLSNPAGVDAATRRRSLDAISRLNQEEFRQFADPETQTRIAQYEMAFRMQTSVPELTDISNEPKHVLDKYGPDVHKPGTFARCALLARRMAERDVRFVQIFHRGWDQHGNLPGDLPNQCRDVDQACLRAGHRPQGARAARGHAGHLGRRVRPDHLLSGQADPRRLRPRPPSQVLPDLDGRRRHQARGRPRPDRRLQLQRRRRPGPHPRPERHDPPLPGHRPPPIELQVPGARRATHRRRGASPGQGDLGLRRWGGRARMRTGIPEQRELDHEREFRNARTRDRPSRDRASSEPTTSG